MARWLPILKWAGLVAAIAALLWWGAVAPRLGLAAERAAHAGTKAAHAEVLAELAAKARHAAELARVASDRVKTDRAELDRRHEEQLRDAKDDADRLRDALHAGTVQLQDRWACRVPGAGEGGAAADAGEADAAGRIDSIARVSEAAAVDAEVIEWLWESWLADRQAVVAGGCAVVAP